MFRTFDLRCKYFKKLVTATIPDPDDLDDSDNIFIQLDWEEHFGSSLRVYEKKNLFPGLLINYEDGRDDDDRDPDWLSQTFEYGFIRFIKLTSHDQISQFPHIIQRAVSQTNSPFFLSDVGALCQNGKEIIGWMFNLPNILFLLMGTPIKVNGMKEIPVYPSGAFMLLLNVGEVISMIKSLKLSKTYGKLANWNMI